MIHVLDLCAVGMTERGEEKKGRERGVGPSVVEEGAKHSCPINPYLELREEKREEKRKEKKRREENRIEKNVEERTNEGVLCCLLSCLAWVSLIVLQRERGERERERERERRDIL
jgi:hypothetical protein